MVRTPTPTGKRPRKFTDKDLADLARQGLTQSEIARILGVSDVAIYHRRRLLGITVAQHHQPRRGIPAERIAWALRQAGSVAAAARLIGCNYNTVRKRALRLGLLPRNDQTTEVAGGGKAADDAGGPEPQSLPEGAAPEEGAGA